MNQMVEQTPAEYRPESPLPEAPAENFRANHPGPVTGRLWTTLRSPWGGRKATAQGQGLHKVMPEPHRPRQICPLRGGGAPPDAVRQKMGHLIQQGLYGAAILWCLSPWASPPMALAAGITLALTIDNPWRQAGHRVSMRLLQACVVLLGFTMNLRTVLAAGLHGAVFGAASITVTLVAGWWLGRRLRIEAKTSLLIASGTAICGGSAIAAVANVVNADEGPVTVAMGTVFLLNAVALYAFVPLGHALALSQRQFGLWAGISIHDISSVVAAAGRYGSLALTIATAVKLSRALWIIPVSLVLAWKVDRTAQTGEGGHTTPLAPDAAAAVSPPQRRRHRIPWFIGLFLLASVFRSLPTGMNAWDPDLTRLGQTGLTVTLFLIGAGLSKRTLAAVGFKPLLQGVLLWALIAGGTLAMIRWGGI